MDDKTKNRMLEKYYNLKGNERDIMKSAAQEGNPQRMLTIGALYLPGERNEDITEFMKTVVHSR
ncbi:MAG: hypothetical protein EOM26_14105 [Alphaproteobacteria bacterium]|nr:hypothetical protein [Alphaproteobacteria bacterium]